MGMLYALFYSRSEISWTRSTSEMSCPENCTVVMMVVVVVIRHFQGDQLFHFIQEYVNFAHNLCEAMVFLQGQ